MSKDYKKLYEDALENLKWIKKANRNNNELVDFIEHKYPELKESEDERIRKDIIAYMRYERKSTEKEIENRFIPWLKKHGEQKEIDYDEELKKCKANPLYFFDKYVKVKLNEQKHVFWSEEDETKLRTAQTFIRNTSLIEVEGIKEATIDWLKSLKERVQSQPKWSEKDEEMRIDAIKYLEIFDAQGIHGDVTWPCIDWLKSLKERMKK